MEELLRPCGTVGGKLYCRFRIGRHVCFQRDDGNRHLTVHWLMRAFSLGLWRRYAWNGAAFSRLCEQLGSITRIIGKIVHFKRSLPLKNRDFVFLNVVYQ